jgi:hypothetical protein
MAHQLARKLGLRMEFFPVLLDSLPDQLSSPQFDVAWLLFQATLRSSGD